MRSPTKLLALASLFAVAGCAPSNPGLVIEGVISTPTSGACLYDPSATTFLVSGVLDTTDMSVPLSTYPIPYSGPRYIAHLRAANHLINLFNNRYPLRADPNVMMVMSADVELQTIDGNPFNFGLPNPFRVGASGVIPSASSDTPGLGVATVDIIPPQYGAVLAAMGIDDLRLNAIVRLTGRTTGDATVTSGEFFFPIDLCSGCLYGCATDPAVIGASFPCNPGQDGVVVFPATGCP